GIGVKRLLKKCIAVGVGGERVACARKIWMAKPFFPASDESRGLDAGQSVGVTLDPQRAFGKSRSRGLLLRHTSGHIIVPLQEIVAPNIPLANFVIAVEPIDHRLKLSALVVGLADADHEAHPIEDAPAGTVFHANGVIEFSRHSARSPWSSPAFVRLTK